MARARTVPVHGPVGAGREREDPAQRTPPGIPAPAAQGRGGAGRGHCGWSLDRELELLGYPGYGLQ